MKYVVETSSTAICRIIVEANSRAEAIDLVNAGNYPEEYDDPVECLNEEIILVEEFSENDN